MVCMKKLLPIFLLLLSIFWFQNGFTQSFDWAKNIGGTGEDDGHSVCTDGFGNIYTLGLFNGTVDFDPGSNTHNLTSAAQWDIFIQKLDPYGNFVWVKQINGGASTFSGTHMVCDSLGNTYSTGFYAGNVDFDPGPDTLNFTGGVFMLKLNTYGNLIWAKSINGIVGTSSCIDVNGNYYNSGHFAGYMDFDPGPGFHYMSSYPSFKKTYLLKLDKFGGFVWVRGMGNAAGNPSHISTDLAGNIYTFSQFENSTDLDPSASVDLRTASGLKDIYLQKLDSNGNYLFAKTMGGNLRTEAKGIGIDGGGNIHLAGLFEGTSDFNPDTSSSFNLSSSGNTDVFIVKLNNNGDFLWARNFGGPGFDQANSIAIDQMSNIYTTGFFEDTADFDPSSSNHNFISKGGLDMFIQKMDSNGLFDFAQHIGSADRDYGNSVVVDINEDIVLTGAFSNNPDFNAGTGTHQLSSYGAQDVSLLKLSDCPSTSSVYTAVACDSFTWIDGITYTQSNYNALHILTNSQGCDSAIVLNLTIAHPVVFADYQSACDSFTWTNGVTYYQSNSSASQQLTSAAGCDSTVLLFLQILQPTTGTDVQSACDSFNWIDGITYYHSNNFAQYTLVNSDGCDSIVNLDLTIFPKVYELNRHSACDSFTWINGITYYQSNNTAQYILSSASGCDSILNLVLDVTTVTDLNVIQIRETLTSYNGFASFQWLDCDSNFQIIPGENLSIFKATRNGSYALELTENGCIDTSECKTITTLSVINKHAESPIYMYPNPAHDLITFNLKVDELSVYNALGQKVYHALEAKEIDLGHIAAGPYFVHFHHNGSTYFSKLVINR